MESLPRYWSEEPSNRPDRARPEELLQTLKDIGYSISDPRKLRLFEEEEAALVHEGSRFNY